MPPDPALPPSTHPRPALLALALWLVAPLPILLGLSSCPVARFLHTPCPGCGMTRAIELMVHGDLAGSVAMHPLAVPTALVQVAFAIVTVALTFRQGSPFGIWSTRVGRLAIYACAVVIGLDLLLWLARMGGLMHGPVPV